jgi:hypothetical protein
MGLSHLFFAAHFLWLVFGRPAPRVEPTLLHAA